MEQLRSILSCPPPIIYRIRGQTCIKGILGGLYLVVVFILILIFFLLVAAKETSNADTYLEATPFNNITANWYIISIPAFIAYGLLLLFLVNYTLRHLVDLETGRPICLFIVLIGTFLSHILMAMKMEGSFNRDWSYVIAPLGICSMIAFCLKTLFLCCRGFCPSQLRKKPKKKQKKQEHDEVERELAEQQRERERIKKLKAAPRVEILKDFELEDIDWSIPKKVFPIFEDDGSEASSERGDESVNEAHGPNLA